MEQTDPKQSGEVALEAGARLMVLAGPYAGSVVDVIVGVTIGRSDTCDLTLSDDSLSRQHARVYFADGALIAEDLGSTNGTFINGKRIQRAELRDGDTLTLGLATVLSVRARDDAAEGRENAERLAMMGRLAATLAHDINNALSVALASYEYLNMELAVRHEPELAAAVSDGKEAVLLAGELSSRIGELSRPNPLQRRPVDFSRAARQVAKLTQRMAHDTCFDVEIEDGLHVEGDQLSLQQMLMNLLVNALDAVDAREGANRVALRVAGSPNEVVVTIADDGCGMDEDTRKHAFDAHFTTKSGRKRGTNPRQQQVARGGEGLGLANVRQILTRHSARIDVQSQEGEGTTITIEVPRYSALASGTRLTRNLGGAYAGIAGAGRRVLIVSPAADTRRGLRRLLNALDYDAHSVASLPEGIDPDDYATVILDHHVDGSLPPLPQTQVIIVSNTVLDPADLLRAHSRTTILVKPLDPAALLEALGPRRRPSQRGASA